MPVSSYTVTEAFCDVCGAGHDATGPKMETIGEMRKAGWAIGTSKGHVQPCRCPKCKGKHVQIPRCSICEVYLQPEDDNGGKVYKCPKCGYTMPLSHINLLRARSSPGKIESQGTTRERGSA